MIKGTLNSAWLFLLLFLGILLPGEALALQVHGEPEGLYVHQMAHLSLHRWPSVISTGTSGAPPLPVADGGFSRCSVF